MVFTRTWSVSFCPFVGRRYFSLGTEHAPVARVSQCVESKRENLGRMAAKIE